MKYILDIGLFWVVITMFSCSQNREFEIPVVMGNTIQDSVCFIEGERGDNFPFFNGVYSNGIDTAFSQFGQREKFAKRMAFYDLDTNWSYDFEIKVDYSQNVFVQRNQSYNTFPVFISNPSSTDSLSFSSLVLSSSNLNISDSLNGNWIGTRSYSDFSWCHIGRIGTFRIPPNSYIVLLYPKEKEGEVVPMKIKYDFWNGRRIESSEFEGIFPKSDYHIFVRSNGEKGLQHKRIDRYYKH